jgi:hypothetical protein
MWFDFQAAIEWSLNYGHAEGRVVPPGENGFITFRRLSALILDRSGLSDKPELNGDDRMAADPEQLRRPPN